MQFFRQILIPRFSELSKKITQSVDIQSPLISLKTKKSKEKQRKTKKNQEKSRKPRKTKKFQEKPKKNKKKTLNH